MQRQKCFKNQTGRRHTCFYGTYDVLPDPLKLKCTACTRGLKDSAGPYGSYDENTLCT